MIIRDVSEIGHTVQSGHSVEQIAYTLFYLEYLQIRGPRIPGVNFSGDVMFKR